LESESYPSALSLQGFPYTFEATDTGAFGTTPHRFPSS
jgi:hypothetical protein